jgi:uncharacterized protein DUF1735/uncharacterized protein DUF4361
MKKNIAQFIFILSLLCIIVTGCLKDDDFDNGSIQSVHNTGADIKPIEIKLTAADATNFFVLAVDNSNNDTVVDLVPINLATADAAPEDIHVTVELDATLINDYDTINAADYAMPASSMYTIVNPEVIIPKGSHTGYLQIKFKPSDFIGGSWALGFKIASVKETGYTISGNLSTGIVAITVKNQYDANYHSTGYVYHPSSPRPVDQTERLSTVSANSVACSFGDLGGSGYVALLTIDPVTNKVTISDYTTGIPIVGFDNGLPSTNPGYTPQWSGSSQCNNTYDPVTKTFYIRMGYLGSTGWRVSEEIIVRQ